MNNFIIDTPDNFWQIRWLDKYMEGHKGLYISNTRSCRIQEKIKCVLD